MKLTALAILAAATGTALYAGQPVGGRVVKVCTPVDGQIEFLTARVKASSLFSRIGVKLEWHSIRQCPADAIEISLSRNTPADLKPGALAYAMPYEGTHIVVFLDRVYAITRVPRAALLGHVMAHEITHILEGCNRHSESGLMKPHWDAADYRVMDNASLAFAAEDINLIQAGLNIRSAKADLAMGTTCAAGFPGATVRVGLPCKSR